VELGEIILGRRESVRKIEVSPNLSTDPQPVFSFVFSVPPIRAL